MAATDRRVRPLSQETPGSRGSRAARMDSARLRAQMPAKGHRGQSWAVGLQIAFDISINAIPIIFNTKTTTTIYKTGINLTNQIQQLSLCKFGFIFSCLKFISLYPGCIVWPLIIIKQYLRS